MSFSVKCRAVVWRKGESYLVSRLDNKERTLVGVDD